jgi:tubulin---tyrosine ligase
MAQDKKKLKILLGLEEAYTRNAIINCLKYRDNNYQVDLYDLKQKQDISSYDIYWLEYEDLDFESFIHSERKLLFNSYCIRKGLIRKAHVAYYIKKYLLKTPNSILSKFIPETYVFELDYLEYLDEAMNDCFEVENELKENEIRILNNEKTIKFILKSSLTNKGAEILLFDRRSQLEDYFIERVRNVNEDEDDDTIDIREWVIQKYVSNPLLLFNKRKFHLRVYVLAVGNLSVYVYENILALFSLKEYDCDNLSKEAFDSHITNTCVQFDNNNSFFDETECVKEFWSLVFDSENKLNDKLIKYKIFNEIKQCVCELFKCLSCEKIVYQPLNNAFELYGFDFLIDSNYNSYFLEANAFPDFKQTGNNLNSLIETLFYQTISISIDKYFGVVNVCEPNALHLVFDHKI